MKAIRLRMFGDFTCDVDGCPAHKTVDLDAVNEVEGQVALLREARAAGWAVWVDATYCPAHADRRPRAPGKAARL